jgi:antitoxin component of MazEF toxin-antitoxin module
MKDNERRIKKIGNGLGIAIPPDLLKALGLHRGDIITFHLVDDTVVMKKSDVPSDLGIDFSEALHYFIDTYSETNRDSKDNLKS